LEYQFSRGYLPWQNIKASGICSTAEELAKVVNALKVVDSSHEQRTHCSILWPVFQPIGLLQHLSVPWLGPKVVDSLVTSLHLVVVVLKVGMRRQVLPGHRPGMMLQHF
jgi:hypothetical protein